MNVCNVCKRNENCELVGDIVYIRNSLIRCRERECVWEQAKDSWDDDHIRLENMLKSIVI